MRRGWYGGEFQGLVVVRVSCGFSFPLCGIWERKYRLRCQTRTSPSSVSGIFRGIVDLEQGTNSTTPYERFLGAGVVVMDETLKNQT